MLTGSGGYLWGHILLTMIKVNELRIGNLIYPRPNTEEHVSVTDIDEYGSVGTTAYFYDGAGTTGATQNTAQPIPLTPEWLERCGFSQQGDWYLLEEGRGLMYSYDDDGSVYGFYIVTEYANLTEWNPRPVYLHQLQNLYFALTGEELQIKNI